MSLVLGFAIVLKLTLLLLQRANSVIVARGLKILHGLTHKSISERFPTQVCIITYSLESDRVARPLVTTG